MNIQLVDSLVEVILRLSPEEKTLFQEKLHGKHLSLQTSNPLTSQTRLFLWQQWMEVAPQSHANLSDEVLSRDYMYDDEG